MPESFLGLTPVERREILQSLSAKMGIRAAVLEKDIWICWTLAQLFEMTNFHPMVFKGGTSLSKAFDAIARFSEDIDITIDHHSLDPHIDLFAKGISRTKVKTLREVLTRRTVECAREVILPRLNKTAVSIGAKCVIEEPAGEKVLIEYEPVISDGGVYWRDNIIVDLGGCNSIQPNVASKIRPYVADQIPQLTFPAPMVTVLSPERTFWEKATLAHAACNRGHFTDDADRQSRHWYDLQKLSEGDIGERALQNRDLLQDVVKYKNACFYANYAKYDECLAKNLRLVPQGKMMEQLKSDFLKMQKEGMFFEQPPSFLELAEGLRALEKRINS